MGRGKTWFETLRFAALLTMKAAAAVRRQDAAQLIRVTLDQRMSLRSLRATVVSLRITSKQKMQLTQ
jgi:hypothetical protein